MSISGEYTLWLKCEECPLYDEFTAPTRMHAKEKAREAGWLLGKYGTAHCPEHANQRRESWRQPRKEA